MAKFNYAMSHTDARPTRQIQLVAVERDLLLMQNAINELQARVAALEARMDDIDDEDGDIGGKK